MTYAQASQQQLSHNITALLDMADNNSLLLDGTKKDVTSSLQKLDNIMNTQSIIEDISVENKGTINNILVKADDVLETLNSSLVSSCQDIKTNNQIVHRVTIMLTINLYTVKWESCVVLKEDGQD